MIVFTIITNSYDRLKQVPVDRKCRYVCITDNVEQEDKGWELLDINKLSPPKVLGGRRLQRWAKIFGAIEYFKEDTIYIDGSYSLYRCITDLFKNTTTELCLKLHPFRQSIEQEIEACIKRGKDDVEVLRKQLEAYKNIKTRQGVTLYETGVMYRSYSPKIRKLCADWWRELAKYSVRDQVSLPVALNNNNIDFEIIQAKYLGLFAKLNFHG